jgi:hypothetical protein
VPDSLLDLLRMRYRPLIERIPELIGCDVSRWLEWDGQRSSASYRPTAITLVAGQDLVDSWR